MHFRWAALCVYINLAVTTLLLIVNHIQFPMPAQRRQFDSFGLGKCFASTSIEGHSLVFSSPNGYRIERAFIWIFIYFLSISSVPALNVLMKAEIPIASVHILEYLRTLPVSGDWCIMVYVMLRWNSNNNNKCILSNWRPKWPWINIEHAQT